MRKSCTAYFGIVRLLAITAILLFAAFTTSASSYDVRVPASAEHGAGCNHCVSVLTDTLVRHDALADQPLHCHLKSPHPQEIGLAPTIVDGNLPLLALDYISTSAWETGMQSPVWTRIPVPAPPRFILFGNFRS